MRAESGSGASASDGNASEMTGRNRKHRSQRMLLLCRKKLMAALLYRIRQRPPMPLRRNRQKPVLPHRDSRRSVLLYRTGRTRKRNLPRKRPAQKKKAGKRKKKLPRKKRRLSMKKSAGGLKEQNIHSADPVIR